MNHHILVLVLPDWSVGGELVQMIRLLATPMGARYPLVLSSLLSVRGWELLLLLWSFVCCLVVDGSDALREGRELFRCGSVQLRPTTVARFVVPWLMITWLFLRSRDHCYDFTASQSRDHPCEDEIIHHVIVPTITWWMISSHGWSRGCRNDHVIVGIITYLVRCTSWSVACVVCGVTWSHCDRMNDHVIGL